MIGVAALFLAAIFAGAALYVSFVEHPARMTLSPEQALAEWAPAYKRGAVMQAALAVLGGVAGLVLWWRWGISLHLAGAVLLLANWSWTLIVIMPVNRRLLTIHAGNGSGEDIRDLLERWARLHGIRTALGLLTCACYAVPLIRF